MYRHLQLLCLFLSFLLPGYGQNGMAGVYERETGKLYLNCDSTYRGFDITKKDTIKSDGRWSVQKNKLVFQIDSITYNKEKITNRTSYILIKDSLLCAKKPSRAEYRDSKRFYKRMCLPQHTPSFAEYKKMMMPKLKRTISYQCR